MDDQKPIAEMTAAEIASEKRMLARWLLDNTEAGMCAYSLVALRNAYDALANDSDDDHAAEARPLCVSGATNA